MSDAGAMTTAGMSADQVRAENAGLDAALLAEAGAFDAGRLAAAPDGEWSAAQVLAHLGEFPHFFAEEVRRWIEDSSSPIGRTMDHPIRLAAVEAPHLSGAHALGGAPPPGEPPVAPLHEDPVENLRRSLIEGMQAAFTELAGELERLTDGDIDAKTENRRYGPEPLSAFLDRYVVGHKAAHLEQLRALAAES
ncbi:MAG TPA: DinB family protein [Gemmatimonadales bacterium]|nr:DinB family protein [Gemmatimonadales bacterium]